MVIILRRVSPRFCPKNEKVSNKIKSDARRASVGFVPETKFPGQMKLRFPSPTGVA